VRAIHVSNTAVKAKPDRRAAPPVSPWRLLLLLAASEALYLALLRLDAVTGAQPVARFLGIMAGLFLLYALAVRALGQLPRRRSVFAIVFGAGLLFRLTLLPAGLPPKAPLVERLDGLRSDLLGERVSYERYLLFDDDLWRYLWDGHVGASGINPYRHAPADPALDDVAETAFWADIRDNVNHPGVPTVYPPLAQGVFRLAHALAPGSVLAMKALLLIFDLATIAFLALALRRLGRAPSEAALYAWNPLVVKVFAGSGHVDAVLLTCLTATAWLALRSGRWSTAVAWGLAVLAKLSPIVLLPFIVRRVGLAAATVGGAVTVLGFLPFIDAGPLLFDGLRRFASSWEFNAGPYHLVKSLASGLVADPATWTRSLMGFVVVCVVVWLGLRDDGRPESFSGRALWALAALLVLGPVVMPWYVTWLLPLAILAREPVWLAFSALVCLAFLVMVDGVEHPGVLWVEYAVLSTLLLQRARKGGSRPFAGESPGKG
jgi:alpha-1,6-mannosyltransferase